MPQSKKWLKENLSAIISAISGFIAGVVTFVFSYYMVYSKTMLQSMTQAEATIVGFLGLIAIYSLTSYDTRLDRLEQQHFDLEMTNNRDKAVSIYEKMKQVESSKSSSIAVVALVSLALIVSLLSSIATQGIVDFNSDSARILSIISLESLFLGIYGMFYVILTGKPQT